MTSQTSENTIFVRFYFTVKYRPTLSNANPDRTPDDYVASALRGSSHINPDSCHDRAFFA